MSSQPPSKKSKGVSVKEKLSKFTTIVADTGDIAQIKKHQPTDATTNPSLILKAATLPEYSTLIDNAIETCKSAIADPSSPWFVKGHTDADLLNLVMDYVSCLIGKEITTVVPGYVSTEVDARLSFNTEATIEKAYRIIKIYESLGVDKSRILIKIASTWEGIQAARVLQAAGISCNLTLLFSLVQAVACADAGCTLISPFVGRIMDWYKKRDGVDGFQPSEDPGVKSVTTIYNYYKKFDHSTIVMGASFRNTGEIKELAGCDRLTISPSLLEQMETDYADLPLKLEASNAESLYEGGPIVVTEDVFRWMMNEDAMATEKLAEGIRNFAKDIVKLEGIMSEKL